MTEEETCLICLDPPLEKNPIFLIGCGCKVGWFHETCKNRWLDSIFQANIFEIRCPACRREVTMKINYSFDYRAGPEQDYLAKTVILFITESVLSFSLLVSGVTYAWILPCESILIFCLPFMFSSNQNIFFYLNHIRARSLITGLYVLFYLLILQTTIHANPWKSFYHLLIPGSLQTILLVLTHLQDHPYPINLQRNPLIPFAISRELVLVSTKSAPLPAERNE